jgi:hypothetical protein
MKALQKRLKNVENQIKNNSQHYDKGNLALLKYEKIILIRRIANYN